MARMISGQLFTKDSFRADVGTSLTIVLGSRGICCLQAMTSIKHILQTGVSRFSLFVWFEPK